MVAYGGTLAGAEVAEKKRGRPAEMPTKPVRIRADIVSRLDFIAGRRGTTAGKLIVDFIESRLAREYAAEKKRFIEED